MCTGIEFYRNLKHEAINVADECLLLITSVPCRSVACLPDCRRSLCRCHFMEDQRFSHLEAHGGLLQVL